MSYYERHRAEILARKKQYYYDNYDERCAYQWRYREAHRAKRSAYNKRYYETHRAECARAVERWCEANPVKCKAKKFAQHHFSLGDCCELCGSTVDLMRFLVEYKIPVDFVVTVCRRCRGFARKSLREMDV